MPLKRPDGRWSVIKINVINELPLLVSAGGSAPELMGTFAETEGHLLFYSTGSVSYTHLDVYKRQMYKKEWT